MEDYKMLEIWATAESARTEVYGRILSKKWALEVDSLGNYWIHPNPKGKQEQDSCYGNTLEHAVQNAAKIRGQAVGYEWAFA